MGLGGGLGMGLGGGLGIGLGGGLGMGLSTSCIANYVTSQVNVITCSMEN